MQKCHHACNILKPITFHRRTGSLIQYNLCGGKSYEGPNSSEIRYVHGTFDKKRKKEEANLLQVIQGHFIVMTYMSSWVFFLHDVIKKTLMQTHAPTTNANLFKTNKRKTKVFVKQRKFN